MNSNLGEGLPTGSAYPYELSNEERGMLPGRVRAHIEILEQENQRLAYEAMHDSLTGLYNRRDFYDMSGMSTPYYSNRTEADAGF